MVLVSGSAIRRFSALALILGLSAIVVWGQGGASAADSAGNAVSPAAPPAILLLQSYHSGYAWDASIQRGILDQLELLPAMELHVEALDALRHIGGDYLDALASLYAVKYRNKIFDILICSDDNAIAFVNQRPELFSFRSLVFCGANNFNAAQYPRLRDFVGVTEIISVRETVELALRLRPRADRLLVVVDNGVTGQRNLGIFFEEAERSAWGNRLRLEVLSAPEPEELSARLAELSEEDIVLYLSYLSTPSGRRFSVEESLRLVSQASKAAIFGMWDFLIPNGVIGGRMVHGYSQGEAAGQLALSLLNGSLVAGQALVVDSPNRYVFDDSLLDQFGIDRGQLPADSLLVNGSGQRFIEQWHGQNRKSDFGYELFENHASTMLLIDPVSGVILDANIQARAFYGYPGLIGMNISQINTLSADEVSAEMSRALSLNRTYFSFRHRLASGQTRDVAVYSSPVHLNGKDVLFSIVQDISEQKRQEQLTARQSLVLAVVIGLAFAVCLALIVLLGLQLNARRHLSQSLRDSQQKLSSLFDSMTEMVVMHELVFDDGGKAGNYRIFDCNQAFTSVTGIRHEQAVGKLATEVYGVSKAPYLELYSKVGISGNPERFEVYFEPMEKHFSISVVNIGTNRFATVSSDITASKKFQQVLAAKNRELEQLVYVASHDLRSPLVNVDGYSRELEYSIGDLETALAAGPAGNGAPQNITKCLKDMKDSLAHVRGSTRQMDGLLKGLLRLSRSGRAALNIQPVNMNELTERVLSSLEYQTRQAGASVSVDRLPDCLGDIVQVNQVLTNLVGNALKYADPARASTIRISGTTDGRRCQYSVSDNGIGIAAEHQEIIFELFHRLNPRDSEGEGLGLTIVRQVLERMNGSISVVSEPGEGSVFTFVLPDARTAATATKVDGHD